MNRRANSNGLFELNSNGVPHFLCYTVAPLSVGVEVDGGAMKTFIKRNCTLPTKASETISVPVKENSVTIKVYAGEYAMTRYNELVGKVELAGISHSPNGVRDIEITFDIDTNQLLGVRATEKVSRVTKRTIFQGRIVRPDTADEDEETSPVSSPQLMPSDVNMEQTNPTHQTVLNAIGKLQKNINSGFELMAKKLNTMEGRLKTIETKIEKSEIHSVPEEPICLFCDNGENVEKHDAETCPKYPDITEKVVAVTDLGLCIRCIKPRHGLCKAECSGCRAPHHKIFCGNGGYRKAFAGQKRPYRP